MNPAEADDDGVTPNNSVTDMKSVLDAMYSAFYDETSGSSSLPLGAVVSGRIDDDAVSTMVAEYDFTLWTGNGATSSVTQTLIDTAYTGGIFSSESSDLPTFAKTTADGTSNSYVYKGNSTTGGAFQIDSTDPSFLRLGTGSAIGAVTFSFTEGTNVKRAVITAHSWTAGTTTGTGNVTYFSVNDSTGQLASRDYVAAPLTFDFTGSDSVTIATTTSGTRGFIFTLAFFN